MKGLDVAFSAVSLAWCRARSGQGPLGGPQDLVVVRPALALRAVKAPAERAIWLPEAAVSLPGEIFECYGDFPPLDFDEREDVLKEPLSGSTERQMMGGALSSLHIRLNPYVAAPALLEPMKCLDTRGQGDDDLESIPSASWPDGYTPISVEQTSRVSFLGDVHTYIVVQP